MSQTSIKRFKRRLHEKLSSYGNRDGSLPAKDAKTDLGYGRIKNDRQSPRQMGSFYPYIQPPSEEGLSDLTDEELELQTIVADKYMADIPVNDPYGRYSIDPFTFAAGNTRLSIIEAFFNPSSVIFELNAVQNSLVPLPGVWRKAVKGGGQGAAIYLTVGHPHRTGMLRGWSSAPFSNDYIEGLEEVEEPEPEEFFTLLDLIKNNEVV